jgi:hypothetical protein
MVGGRRGDLDEFGCILKLGLVIQHYDARNDVRDLVDLLSAEHEVVLFGDVQKLQDIQTQLEKREFRQQARLSDRIWLQLFNFFGELPATRNNFLVTELFKLAALPRARRQIAAARLRMRMHLPSLMSFDFLLNRLMGSDTTEVADIDRFLVITELSSPGFLARLIDAGKPVDAYVYSWDHACKHASFSRRIDRWFVWHEGITEDLVKLQSLPRERIEVVGATQLAYIHEYLGSPDLRSRKIDGRYIYFGCGVGHLDMARQEARLIDFLARTLHAVEPSVTLLVRPYPMLAESDFFKLLRDQPNVRFDEDYRAGRKDRSLTREAIFDRLNMQEHAAAFVHCGTTMGLEGAYLGSPVLFLDLQDFDYGVPVDHHLHLRKFIHQYHNERYMILDGFPNVVKTAGALRDALASVLATPQQFMEYNHAIGEQIGLQGLSEIASRVSSRHQ